MVVLSAILMIGFMIFYRKKPLRGLRPIPAFNYLRQAIGLAVEDGSRLHISLGKASLIDGQVASGLVGLTVLNRIAQYSSISDSPPIATSGDGGLMILSQDTLRSTYRSLNVSELYDGTNGRMTGVTPMAYVAGATFAQKDENVSANILIGNFGPEIGLLAHTARSEDDLTLAASDALPAQAVLYMIAKKPLIGEELFSCGAYLQAGPFHAASLRAQDVLRVIIIVALFAGSILKLLGVL
jgi:hypothetical protein